MRSKDFRAPKHVDKDLFDRVNKIQDLLDRWVGYEAIRRFSGERISWRLCDRMAEWIKTRLKREDLDMTGVDIRVRPAPLKNRVMILAVQASFTVRS